MGFHVCEYCDSEPATSSGDVTMSFSSGRTYRAPDMLPHYVSEHQFAPPEHFVDDVLNTELVSGDRQQTRSAAQETEAVGYLSGEFSKGAVPDGFVQKLKRVMELADQLGGRQQTKGPIIDKPPGTRSA